MILLSSPLWLAEILQVGEFGLRHFPVAAIHTFPLEGDGPWTRAFCMYLFLPMNRWSCLMDSVGPPICLVQDGFSSRAAALQDLMQSSFSSSTLESWRWVGIKGGTLDMQTLGSGAPSHRRCPPSPTSLSPRERTKCAPGPNLLPLPIHSGAWVTYRHVFALFSPKEPFHYGVGSNFFSLHAGNAQQFHFFALDGLCLRWYFHTDCRADTHWAEMEQTPRHGAAVRLHRWAEGRPIFT